MIGRRFLTFTVVVVACLISLATTTRQTGRDRGQAASGETVMGRIVAVADGDTLTVLD
jgi:hypothetical protein